MTLDVGRFASHLNMTHDEVNVVGDQLLAVILDAAKAHTAASLGFAVDDPIEFPDGTPADVELAVLMLAAHWFAQRESTTVVTMIPAPFGFDDIVRNHRRWVFG